MSRQPDDSLQSHRIYRRLRHAIVTCEIRPGERLRVVDIAGREGVSPGAVREALSSLASEHVVLPLPQRGFRVAEIDREDMIDLFTTRAALESDLAARSVALAAPEWKAGLTAAWEAMQAFGESPTINDGAAAAHEAFHRALIAGCGSVWSLRFFETIYIASERYRFFAYRYLADGRNPHQEHAALHAAAMAGDAGRVRALSREHILTTRDRLAQALADMGQPGQ